MQAAEAALLAGAGLVAGTANTIAGAGSLLTFPTLIATGLSPLAANVTNCIGLVAGSASGAWGMRELLVGQRRALVRLSVWVCLGSLTGAVLLLALPGEAFDLVVPVLVGLAGLLVLAQPLVVRLTRRTPEAPASAAMGPSIAAVGIYSGYFGAAQGVMLVGVLGVVAPQPLRQLNAVKNVLALAANGTAGVLYAVVAPVQWGAVGLLAVGSVFGGPLGALLAKRIPAGPLRVGIAAVALTVAVQLALQSW